MDLDEKLSIRLSYSKELGMYRTLQIMNTAPSPRMMVDGKHQLVFSSHNYLGLANNKSLIYAAETILHEFGVGSSGLGLTTGYTEWHQKLENQIAEFMKAEAAILFTSAALANNGVLSSLPEKGDIIISDVLNNISIIDGCRLSEAETVNYNHTNMDDLEQKLIDSQSYQCRYIVTEGIFCRDGTISPMDKIMSLAKQYQAYVIVDESHSVGVIGSKGRGMSERFNVKPDVVIGSLATAVGSKGGFVCGSPLLIDFLRNQARTFIYQTTTPPAICAASYAAIEIMERSDEKRELLFSNVNQIKTSLGEMGFFVKGDLTPIIPIILGDSHIADTFVKRLREDGVHTSALHIPSGEHSENYIRLTVTSEHSSNDIEFLLRRFYLIGRELNVI